MTFGLSHVYSVKNLVIDQIVTALSSVCEFFVDCGFSSFLCHSQCFIV